MNRFSLLLLVFAVLIVGAMVWTSGFGPEWTGSDDEGFRLHAAWVTSQGYLPYRDFFDNQMPDFNFLTAPLFWLFGPNPGYLRAGQWLYLGLLGGGFLVVSRNQLGAALPGVLTILVLGASPATGTLTGEFRPDLPAVTLGLLGVLSLNHALTSRGPARLSALTGGLLLGLSPFVKISGLFLLPAACYLLLVERTRPHYGSVMFTFSTTFCFTFLGQLLFWGLLSPRFLEYTIGTHQLAVPGGNLTGVLSDWGLAHIVVLIGLVLYWLIPRNRSPLELAFFVTAGLGLLYYVSSPPSTPSLRHLFGITVLLSYPAGVAYAGLLRKVFPPRATKTFLLSAVVLGLAVLAVLLNSPLKHRPHVKELADWVQQQTDGEATVLTDFPYINLLARRPQPPALANVSSNLTYTGYIDRRRINRAFRENPPQLILVQLHPHPWHLANIPGIEPIMIDWLSDYDFSGIKSPSNSLYLVFARQGLNPANVTTSPEILQRELGPILKKFDWNELSRRLLGTTTPVN